MDALILAAGLGTRLRPLTDATPKALVRVGGITLLERVVRRLVGAGVERLVINVHHHAEAIEAFLADAATWPELRDAQVELFVSREDPEPLETGGGLKQAAPLLSGQGPFFLHNVDVITSIDLVEMYRRHEAAGALATLAVNRRPASRYLLFDDEGLFGREDALAGTHRAVREPNGPVLKAGFTGIHVIDRRFLDLIVEDGVFSIMRPYLRLAAAGYRITPYDASSALWLEIGTPERLTEARRVLADTDPRPGPARSS